MKTKIQVLQILSAELTLSFFRFSFFYRSYALEYPWVRVWDTTPVRRTLALLTEIINHREKIF